MVVALVVGAAAVWAAHALKGSNFDWKLAWASLAGLNHGWLAASLIPIAGCYWGRALRWRVFLRPMKSHPSMRNLLAATIIGFTAITMFGRAGEFVRPYLIALKEKVSVPSQLAALVLERIFDTLMALLIFGIALMRLAATGTHGGPRLGWILKTGGWTVAIACLLVLILLLSLRHLAEPFQRWALKALRFLPEKQFVRAEHLIAALLQGVESTRSDMALLLVFLYSVLEWILIVAVYWCITRAFWGIVPLHFMDIIVFLGFVSFGSIVQIPGIGGGTQVVAVLVLGEIFHVQVEIATSFAFVVWFITFVAIVPVGLVVAFTEGLNWGSLRKMSRETT